MPEIDLDTIHRYVNQGAADILGDHVRRGPITIADVPSLAQAVATRVTAGIAPVADAAVSRLAGQVITDLIAGVEAGTQGAAPGSVAATLIGWHNAYRAASEATQ